MKSIRILIVEDEPIIAADMSLILEDLGYEVVGVKYDVPETIEFLENNSVDLLLLDINLDDGQDGIELAKIINERFQIPFIYLTSHSDTKTITRAKETNPLAYLVKPIDEKDLITTIEIAFHNYNTGSHVAASVKEQPESIFIKSGSAFQKLNIKEICYAEANDNYTFVHTQKKKFLLSCTLKVVEAKLADWDFIRVHRSYLINLSQIEKIEEGFVYLNGQAIPVSRKHKKELMDRLSIF